MSIQRPDPAYYSLLGAPSYPFKIVHDRIRDRTPETSQKLEIIKEFRILTKPPFGNYYYRSSRGLRRGLYATIFKPRSRRTVQNENEAGSNAGSATAAPESSAASIWRCDQCGAEKQPWQAPDAWACPNANSPHGACDGVLKLESSRSAHGAAPPPTPDMLRLLRRLLRRLHDRWHRRPPTGEAYRLIGGGAADGSAGRPEDAQVLAQMFRLGWIEAGPRVNVEASSLHREQRAIVLTKLGTEVLGLTQAVHEDFTGTPAVCSLAAMRDAFDKLEAARNMEADCTLGAGAGFGKYTREVAERRRGAQTPDDDLTPEQLDDMELWDRDAMLAPEHRVVGAYLVKKAVTEIRRRRREASQFYDMERPANLAGSTRTTLEPDDDLATAFQTGLSAVDPRWADSSDKPGGVAMLVYEGDDAAVRSQFERRADLIAHYKREAQTAIDAFCWGVRNLAAKEVTLWLVDPRRRKPRTSTLGVEPALVAPASTRALHAWRLVGEVMHEFELCLVHFGPEVFPVKLIWPGNYVSCVTASDFAAGLRALIANAHTGHRIREIINAG